MIRIGLSRHPLAFATLLIITAAACSSGDASVDTRAEPTITPATEIARATETAPPAQPSGQPLVEGLPIVEALGPTELNAGPAPEFSWEPVAAATRYSLAVRGPDGPLWAWQGEETQIYLGGLPFDRPPAWPGPVIVAGTCWSVMARDVDGHVIAASQLLPVSPDDSPSQACVPGAGEEPGA